MRIVGFPPRPWKLGAVEIFGGKRRLMVDGSRHWESKAAAASYSPAKATPNGSSVDHSGTAADCTYRASMNRSEPALPRARSGSAGRVGHGIVAQSSYRA